MLLLAACLSILATSTFAASTHAKFVYFFNCGGDFLKIDLRTRQVVSQWAFSRLAGVAELVPSGRIDGCFLLGARYDAKTLRLYGVFPKNSNVGEDGTRDYQIIVLRLPQLDILGAIDFPALQYPPAIVVSPDGARLLVAYRDFSSQKETADNTIVSVVAVYDARRLEKIRVVRENTGKDDYLAGAVINASFSPAAYYGSNTETLYDKDAQIIIKNDRFLKQRLNRFQVLTEAQKRELERFRQVDPLSGQQFLPIHYADSHSGNALLFVGTPPMAEGRIIVVDLSSSRTIAMIEAPPVSATTAHLTPDGKKVVVEHIELRKVNSQRRPRVYKRGGFAVYDVASAKQLKKLKDREELAGFGSKLICVAPAGDVIFYVADGGLYEINLMKDTAVKLKSGFVADEWTKCVVSDR